MSVRFLISSVALVGLTACGGGGGGSTLPPTDLGDMTASYSDLSGEFDNLQSTFAAGVASSLPTGNGVEYGGQVLIAEDLYDGSSTSIDGSSVLLDDAGVSSSGYIGEVLLTANFASGTASGEVDNFYGTTISTAGPTGSTGALSTSSLTLSNGTISGTDAFSMDVSGSIDSQTAGGNVIVRFYQSNGSLFLLESQLSDPLTLDTTPFDARGNGRLR